MCIRDSLLSGRLANDVAAVLRTFRRPGRKAETTYPLLDRRLHATLPAVPAQTFAAAGQRPQFVLFRGKGEEYASHASRTRIEVGYDDLFVGAESVVAVHCGYLSSCGHILAVAARYLSCHPFRICGGQQQGLRNRASAVTCPARPVGSFEHIAELLDSQ